MCLLFGKLTSIHYFWWKIKCLIYFLSTSWKWKKIREKKFGFSYFYLFSLRWADKHRLCSPKRKVFLYQQQQHETGEISWKENVCVCVCVFTTTNNKMGLFFRSFYLYYYLFSFIWFSFIASLLNWNVSICCLQRKGKFSRK